MTDIYHTPEYEARDKIDPMLNQAGWKVQSKNKLDFSARPGIAVREYQTTVGPAELKWVNNQKPLPFANITGPSDTFSTCNR